MTQMKGDANVGSQICNLCRSSLSSNSFWCASGRSSRQRETRCLRSDITTNQLDYALLRGHVGYGRGDADLIFNTRNDAGHFWNLDHEIKGRLYGAQLGYDKQLNSYVFGIVGDYSFSRADGSRRNPQDGSNFIGVGAPVNGPPVNFETELENIATIRARAGILITSNFLAYGHAGAAFGKFRLSGSGGPANNFNTQTDWTTGYVIGAGVEAALMQNVSLFLEYSHFNFQESDLFLIVNPNNGDYQGGVNNQGRDFDAVKFGVNFKMPTSRYSDELK